MNLQLTSIPISPAAPGETLPSTGTKLLMLLLIGLSALGEVSTQLMLPILPEAAKALHTNPAGMQASMSLFVATLGCVVRTHRWDTVGNFHRAIWYGVLGLVGVCQLRFQYWDWCDFFFSLGITHVISTGG